MTNTLLLIAAVVALGAIYVVLPVMSDAYRRLRGRRLVRCPETGEAAGVEVNATRAALTASVGAVELRLKDCSRWPERGDCGQECLRQIEEAPEDCLVRTILAKWYEGKSCVLCGHAFGGLRSLSNKPGLRAPEGTTLEWGDVRAEDLPRVLSSHQPVCWNCHVAETFRRQFPDLVIDARR